MRKTFSFTLGQALFALGLLSMSGYLCWYMHRTQVELNRVENFLQHMMMSGQPQ